MTPEETQVCRSIRQAIETSEPRMYVRNLAGRLGVTHDKLYNITLGRTRATTEIVDGLRRILSLPPDWPYGSVADAESKGLKRLAGSLPMVRVKPLGKAAAGDAANGVDSDEDGVYVPERLANISDVFYVAEGDSLYPHVQIGDVCGFRKQPHPQPRLTYLLRGDGKFRMKLLKWDNTAGWMMHSTNPLYEPEPLGENQVLGFLVGWFRSKGARESMDSDLYGLRLEE